MGEAVLALLGGTLFTPLAIAYVVALVLAVFVLYRESGRDAEEEGTARE